jgi:histidine triad (HIT) family protein
MDTSDCVFCNIINRTIDSSNILKETDDVVAIKDILPKAPTHLIIVPKAHIESANDLTVDQAGLVGKMALLARDMAQELGVADSGYKLVINVGKHGGQTVKHLHMHMLGGKQLAELGI